MAEAAIAEGHVVAGRYRLVAPLGRGGMGAVWRADHVTLRSHVAVKLLHREVLDSDDGLRRFLAEAQAAAMLRSPHVVQILDHGVDGGTPYIAMELLDGESLATRLDRVGTLTLSQTARLVTHIARAVGKAHEVGIVHRDLKPDNIFLVSNDDEEIAKVLDFGIAKITHGLGEPAAKVNTKEGSLLGTPNYMSPEQVRGHALDGRSDLFSMAVIAFECVCGRVPFEGETVGDLLLAICTDPIPAPSSVRPVPAGFDAWFARAAARDPAARFQSARELAEALRALTDGDKASASGRFSSPPDDSAPHEKITVQSSDSLANLSTMRPSDKDPARALIENARTVSHGTASRGTMDGATAHAPASVAPRGGARLGLAAAALAALGLVAYFGLADRRPVHAAEAKADPAPAGQTASGPPPAATPASAAPATAPDPAPSSKPAPVAPAESASARPASPPRPAAPPPARPKKKEDELLF